jgi:hypothetical protein
MYFVQDAQVRNVSRQPFLLARRVVRVATLKTRRNGLKPWFKQCLHVQDAVTQRALRDMLSVLMTLDEIVISRARAPPSKLQGAP